MKILNYFRSFIYGFLMHWGINAPYGVPWGISILVCEKSSEKSLKQSCTALFPISSRLKTFLHFWSKGTLEVSDRLSQKFKAEKKILEGLFSYAKSSVRHGYRLISIKCWIPALIKNSYFKI